MWRRKQAPAPLVTKEQYEAMTPAERRVALAKDVLQLMDARIIKPGSHYLKEDDFETHACEEFVADPRCVVCARGALAVSWARAADEFQARGMVDTTKLYRAASWGEFGFMSEVFGDDPELFEEVENAFEVYLEYSPHSRTNDPARVAWAERHTTPSARLRAICRSLIVNNGAFVPVPAGGAS